MNATALSIWDRLRYTRLRDLLRGRLNACLDWRLVVAEANLPAEMNGVIEQVVRHTRLWRSEKVDVAAELVAHFQDGLEAGCSPDELVKSFGEPQQTAQLIRRAKKRGRSLIWQLWRYGCWAFGALVVAYIVAGLWMFLDRPSVKVDYLAVINKPALAVPESERAWPLYRDALLAMNAKPSSSDLNNPFALAAGSKPGDANWSETQRFLNDHADSIGKLRDAAARHDLGFIATTSHAAFSADDRKLFGVTVTPEDMEAAKNQTVQSHWVISTLLPHLNLLRMAALLIANDALRAAASGDGEMAAKDIAALFGISRHCQEFPFLVNLLVAEDIQRQARVAIQDVLRNHPQAWTKDQLRDLAHQTAAAQLDWRRGFIGERVSFYDSMQRIYTDDGNGDGRLALHINEFQNLFELLSAATSNMMTDGSDQRSTTPLSHAGLALLAMPATNMLVASRKEMTEVYQRFSDRALERLETPLWETANSPSADEDLLTLKSEPFGKFRYLFVNLLLPAHDKVRNRYATSQGEREGVLVGLALELYHREHDKWPATLNELSPRWLPELPVDRMTGEPLKYKVEDDRPIVYSVGVDGDDDGGRAPTSDVETGADSATSPANSQPGSVDNAAHDGDWFIWSTAKRPITAG